MKTLAERSYEICDIASEAAGDGPGWNARFLFELSSRGWAIHPIVAQTFLGRRPNNGADSDEWTGRLSLSVGNCADRLERARLARLRKGFMAPSIVLAPGFCLRLQPGLRSSGSINAIGTLRNDALKPGALAGSKKRARIRERV